MRSDALTFGAAVPHTWRNLSPDSDSRVLWILAPALPGFGGTADLPSGAGIHCASDTPMKVRI